MLLCACTVSSCALKTGDNLHCRNSCCHSLGVAAYLKGSEIVSEVLFQNALQQLNACTVSSCSFQNWRQSPVKMIVNGLVLGLFMLYNSLQSVLGWISRQAKQWHLVYLCMFKAMDSSGIALQLSLHLIVVTVSLIHAIVDVCGFSK